MAPDLWRRGFAEALGTALLTLAVVGSGIAAERLSPGDTGLQLLENALATAAALAAVILAVGPVSGAHLNPVVTVAARAFGALSTREAASYVGAQVAGAALGAVVANTLFSLPAIELSTESRSSAALWSSEVVATFGLLLVVFSVARSGRPATAPLAVGAYIGGAYFFTSSTSFANPAVTVARCLSDTFAGIAPGSVPAFVLAQVVGAALAVGAVRALHPPEGRPVPEQNRVETGAADRRPAVLFLCVHNAGRSQMALGWFNHLAGGRAVAWSGGSEPGGAVNPAAVAAMAEVGVDISREFPKPWTEEIVRAADVVITMGCGDACPSYPGRRYEDWELTDPAGLPVEEIRPIRDEIGRRVSQLLQSMSISTVG